jgi:threonine aldolase
MADFIELRSDTYTKPTAPMRAAMANAEVGDDMFGEDPTVNRLEARVAEMLGMEAAVYACSGTQSNQMAVWAHCERGDELLVEETGHIANYEAGAPAVLSGVTVRRLPGDGGRLDVAQLEGQVRGGNYHFATTRLVCLENSTNVGGGRTYPLAQLRRVCEWAKQQGLRTHLDGARLFNACIARGYSPREAAVGFDSVSICFSKGLGCPMGSILVGSREIVQRARKARKVFGGSLRQAGIVAASAEYALDHHVTRLKDDHEHARLFAEAIATIDGVTVRPGDVETNLVFFGIDPTRLSVATMSADLRKRGVLINPLGPWLRACTHLDVTRDQVLRAADIVREILTKPREATTPEVVFSPYA